MSKDPAVLFYTSDFISGTITMTDEQRGKYILLLCLQHQKGHLTENDMLNICKTYDKDIWSKFYEEDGKFYNERMRVEATKRAQYSESRRINRLNKQKEKNISPIICKSYVKHMENENENVIIDSNIIDSSIIKKEKEKEKEKTWRTDFQIYLLGLDTVYQELISDFNFITEQEELNPGIDIVLSLKKAYTNFWGKEAGWVHKKKQRSKTLDWKSTLTNAISMNKVYKEKTQQRKGTSVAQMQQMINEHNSSLTIQEWNQLR